MARLPTLFVAAAAAAAATAVLAQSSSSPSVRLTTASAGVLDASVALTTYSLAESPVAGQKSSFAISDDGTYARVAWGIADYATLGSHIVEKNVALGGVGNRYMVRNWLQKVPLTPSGRAFGTEGGELHMAGQGAMEGTAEVILAARHFAAHTADSAAFSTVPERMVCWVGADGAPHLAGVGHPGLDDSACSESPSGLVQGPYGARYYNEGPISPSSVTFGNSTKKTTVQAHAKALLQYVTLTQPFVGLSLGLSVGGGSAGGGGEVGGLLAILQDAETGTVISTTPLPSSGGFPRSGWLTIGAGDGATLPPGTYAIHLAPPPAGTAPGSAFALQWVTDGLPASNGSASYYTYLGADFPTAVPQLAPPATLGQQLGRMVGWQLGLMLLPASSPPAYDVLVIRDAAFRGAAQGAVNSGSSFYDLLRMGFAAGYINLRVLESLVAFREMAAAGLVAPVAGLDGAISQLRSAIGSRFGDPAKGTFVSWYGCTCVDPATNLTTCPLSSITPTAAPADPCMQVFDIGFLPAQALAVKLGVVAGEGNGGSFETTVGALRALRDAARYGAGQFRTNTRPIEGPGADLSPEAWLASDRWNDKDSEGFAVRESNQTGDWHCFSPADGADGNGNWGLQEENGGRLLSTSSFIFEVGDGGASPGSLFGASPYPELASDWSAFVSAITNMSLQLSAGDYSTPLLAGSNPPLTRTLFAPGGIPQHLCAAARGSASLTKLDLFGSVWCDYYKSVSYDLPEAGLPLYAALKALVGIYVNASGQLSVFGVPLPVPGSTGPIPLPAGWPQDVTAIEISGINVGAVSKGGAGGDTAASITCTVGAAAAAAAAGGSSSSSTLSCTASPVAATSAAATSAAAASAYTISDVQGMGPRFGGVGAISGGGATSRFLPDYDPAVSSQIFDYLFAPNFGAALHHLKVEIGGEALATEGSEASHMRLPPGQGDEDYTRGYEWFVLNAAKARNPHVEFSSLPWTWPGWVGDAVHRDPFSGNVSLPAIYVASWVRGALQQHNLSMLWVGVWNERESAGAPAYIKELRRQLDGMGLQSTGILCDDSKYYCAPQMLADPELAAAVAYVGGHDPATPEALQTGKPVYFSEDFHAKGGEAGAGTWASQINRRYQDYGMTATLAWNAVASFYSGLSFDNTGLMSAQQPWSGSYEVLGTVWATAHTTQFTLPGWSYAKLASTGAGGCGRMAAGGSYNAYRSPAAGGGGGGGGGGGDFTIVVEKFSNVDGGAKAENATFCLAGSFAAGTGLGPLQVWQSTFAVQPGEVSSYLVRQSPVTADPTTHCFTLAVPLDSVTTLTTLTTGGRGSHPTPAAPAAFPLPYADDFESCVSPSPGRYWSDISGTWECVASSSSSSSSSSGPSSSSSSPHGTVMRMQTPAKPVSWESDFRPHSVLGDKSWANVNFTVDVLIPASAPGGSLAVVGVRCTLLNQTDYSALMAEIQFPGLWFGLNATGGWGLWSSIAAVGNFSRGGGGSGPSAGLVASGALPIPLPAGQWVTVSLVALDNSLAATAGGQTAFEGLSTSPYPYTGWVGIGTGDYGQAVEFDNVVVSPTA